MSNTQPPLSPCHNGNHLHRIGQAAQLSGVSTANIRHYEKQGLLRSGVRAENQYRYYSDEDVHTLKLIRLCRSMNMSLEEVAQVLSLDANRAQDCSNATRTVEQHLVHVRERIQELKVLEAQLQQLLATCAGDTPSCHLIEALHTLADEMPANASTFVSAKPRHV